MASLPDHELARLVGEDAPSGDLTTDTLGIGRRHARLSFRPRQEMTVCGVEEAVRLFVLAGADAHVLHPSGSVVGADVVILEAAGSAAALHHAYKTAQVLVEWASGIASAAAAMVGAANGVPVACTRKNVPGTKALSVKAVKAGGATMHRLGLSETLLVFEEHRVFLDEPPEATIGRLKRAEPEKKVVVEVADVDQAVLWLRAGADVLQLERFSVELVAECRRLARTDFSGVKLAAAGGIHAGNAAAYAAAGADLLVTSAPYAAPPRDVKVDFEAL